MGICRLCCLTDYSASFTLALFLFFFSLQLHHNEEGKARVWSVWCTRFYRLRRRTSKGTSSMFNSFPTKKEKEWTRTRVGNGSIKRTTMGINLPVSGTGIVLPGWSAVPCVQCVGVGLLQSLSKVAWWHYCYHQLASPKQLDASKT